MIVKFFRHGTGGSGSVFNYLLGKDGDRPDADVLRGDITTQKHLIDSLTFKRQYTSGCLSFEEAPDHLNDQQKDAIMDSFEATITAGLEADRVSFSWIEHRDKGRLELNFVIANVDLQHGRLFQPYVHSQDKRRINAWKDLQNIEYDLADPNDPARKRLMGQRDNLPRDIKQIRQDITDGLKSMIEDGLVSKRQDVTQALEEAGFEIARQTPSSISIKNPNGKRNIRLTGKIYERDFHFSPELQEEVERSSQNYREGSRGRHQKAQRLHDSEIERKRGYHQGRHEKPRHEQRGLKDPANHAKGQYRYCSQNLFRAAPSPFNPRFRRSNRTNADDDRELRHTHRGVDQAAREETHRHHQIRRENLDDNSWSHWPHLIRSRCDSRRYHRSEVFQADTNYPAATDTAAHKLRAEIRYGQETTRPNTASNASPAGHHQTPKTDAKRSRAVYGADAEQKRSGYSGIDGLIEQIGQNEDTGARTLADVVQTVASFNERANERLQWMDQASERSRNNASCVDKRVIGIRERTNSAHRAVEDVSEYDNTARLYRERYGAARAQYDAVKERIEQTSERTKKNRVIAEDNDKLTAKLEIGIQGVRQAAEETRDAIKAKEQEIERARTPTRSRYPSMGR